MQKQCSFSLLSTIRSQLTHTFFQRMSSVASVFQLGRSFRSTAIGVGSFRWKSFIQLLQSYKKLSKAKLSTFVVASTGAGFVLASNDVIGDAIHPLFVFSLFLCDLDGQKLGCTLLGTFGASACANTFNQILEWKKDALMGRTRLRPLPSGQITRFHAFIFAFITGISGVSLLAYTVS